MQYNEHPVKETPGRGDNISGTWMMKRFNDLVLAAVRGGFSDLHVTGGQPLVFRKDGTIHFDNTLQWSHREIDHLVKSLLNDRQLQILKKRWSVDCAINVNQVRIRVNVFNTINGLSLAIRLLPGIVPTLRKLNLHSSLEQIREIKAGLVLICGTTGCGKSTTIAALVNEVNNTRPAHIITLEDPIELRFQSNKSLIEQREIGTHMPSFEQGLLDVLREDPDVIVVGELREPETIRLTLNAAEAGHLVIASLHASNCEEAIYRICNSFSAEAQEEIRHQLASTLAWVIVQQLVYVDRIGFRVPLLSIMKGTPPVKGIIRENKLHQIENAIHTGRNDGMWAASRYLNEFINLSDSFIHPAQNFKASEEPLQDITYASSLINADAHMDQVIINDYELRESKTKIGGPKPVSEEHARDEFSQHYTIVDYGNVKDLIAQLDRPDRHK